MLTKIPIKNKFSDIFKNELGKCNKGHAELYIEYRFRYSNIS